MKKILIILSFLVSISLFTANYKTDRAHSDVTFSIAHLLISDVSGRFGDFDFNLELDNRNRIKSLVGKIQVTSVDTNNDKRDDHLRSADFFEADKYPEITFESTSYRGNASKGKLQGVLTIKGVSKKVTLNVTQSKIIDFKGKKKLGIVLTTDMDRRDFGVGDSTPNAIVSNDLEAKITIEFDEA